MSAKLPSRFDELADRLVEAVAPLFIERAAELIAERFGELPPLLDAAGAARFLGVDEVSVRRMARAGQIPSIRLGDGPKPRWRFDPDQLRLQLSHGSNGTECDGMTSAGAQSAKSAAGAAMVNLQGQPTQSEEKL